MRFISADVHPKDTAAVELLVRSMRQKDPTITMKKYVRWCVIEMSNQLFAGLENEMKKKKELADVEAVHSTEHAASPISEVNSGEGSVG